MTEIIEICNLLKASKTLLHQIHLKFTDYADHLLADRLSEGLQDNIDRLKELYISVYDEDIANALPSASEEAEYLKQIPSSENKDENNLFAAQLQFFKTLISLCTEVEDKSDNIGIRNAVADIGEDIQRKIYLTQNRLKSKK